MVVLSSLMKGESTSVRCMSDKHPYGDGGALGIVHPLQILGGREGGMRWRNTVVEVEALASPSWCSGVHTPEAEDARLDTEDTFDLLSLLHGEDGDEDSAPPLVEPAGDEEDPQYFFHPRRDVMSQRRRDILRLPKGKAMVVCSDPLPPTKVKTALNEERLHVDDVDDATKDTPPLGPSCVSTTTHLFLSPTIPPSSGTPFSIIGTDEDSLAAPLSFRAATVSSAEAERSAPPRKLQLPCNISRSARDALYIPPATASPCHPVLSHDDATRFNQHPALLLPHGQGRFVERIYWSEGAPEDDIPDDFFRQLFF